VDGVGDENLADAKVIDILEKTAKTHPRNLGCSNNFINENKNVITEIGFVMEHHPCTPSKVYKTKHIR
jgi:hypothetical protein